MNYLKEILAFYDHLETNPLSTKAIALWHALIHTNNKAAWIDKFTVATITLSAKTGLSDRSVRNARKELTEKGYIKFDSRSGNQSAVYQIVSLSATVSDSQYQESNLSEQMPEIVSGKNEQSANNAGKHSGKHSALNKQNKTIYAHAHEQSTKYTDEKFNEFWKVYPNKKGKQRAYRLWQSRVKDVNPDDFIKAAKNYAKRCEHEQTPQRYIKHPSTFLSTKNDYLDWLDYEVENKPQPKSKSEYWQEKFKKEEELERKQVDLRTEEIKVNQFVRAGLSPLFHKEVLASWLARGGQERELEELAKQHA